jgi:hypothetical protein
MSGVAGCSTAPPASSYCALAAPIWPSRADALVISDDLVAGLLRHNSRWALLCEQGIHDPKVIAR